MSDANELHPVGLVASSVDPTIKSATSAPVGSDPKERFKALEGLASTYLDKDELALLEKAFLFAEEMHAGQKRKSGEAFVIHPVEVAIILADLHMDVETLIAALCTTRWKTLLPPSSRWPKCSAIRLPNWLTA